MVKWQSGRVAEWQSGEMANVFRENCFYLSMSVDLGARLPPESECRKFGSEGIVFRAATLFEFGSLLTQSQHTQVTVPLHLPLC